MAKPIEIYVQIVDAKGDASTVTIPIPVTMLASASGFATGMLALIAPLIGGSITAAGYSVPINVAAPVAAAIASDVQEKARFGFRTITGFLKRIGIPTFLETLFSPNSKNVNTSDADVAAFVTAMEDGIDVAGTTVAPCDNHGDSLTLLETAVEDWGRSRG